MRQTSLIQSWIRTQHSSKSTESGPIIIDDDDVPVSGTSTNQQQSRALDCDPDDRLLTDALDAYTGATGSNESDENSAVMAKLQSRTSISYRPTGNDSDQLAGFDLETGKNWLYPLNASLREYQFHITEQCLYKNTLVCLPTGLGKTFIAAVSMYNFLRWYPQGKAVFMAPTRPLVAQQEIACRQLIGPLSDSVVQLTGSIPQSRRRHLWTSLRAFFLTPHVLANDLEAGVCPSGDLRLLVFDEAHKATGNHSYCQVLRLLTGPPHDHRQFRILALSATPASDIQGVQAVIANLLISHLELRTDNSADIKRYTQTRHIETIVVPLGPELTQFRCQLVNCVRLPLERLQQRGALRPGLGDLRPDRVAKYTVVKARADWSASPEAKSIDSGSIQSDFGVLICLLHAIELLDQHGLRPLYQYLSGVLSGQRASAFVRAELLRVPGINELWSDLTVRFPNQSSDGMTATQVPFSGGHPKLEKLRELLQKHFFNTCNPEETRVIVFSQFRDSVDEIMHMLKQLRPLVRPASFVGQSSGKISTPSWATPADTSTTPTAPQSASSGGISQRDQLRVMQAFRTGAHNTLVSTCIGEEGLDVGQVDLIVCFDAFKSPIRLMQRFGRTGRQRVGRIVMLLTEGREERNHAISMSRTNLIHKSLLEGSAYKRLAFYPNNPRMVPLGIDPVVQFKRFDTASLLDATDCCPGPKGLSERRRKKQTESALNESLKNHMELVDIDQLNLQLCPLVPSRLIGHQTASAVAFSDDTSQSTYATKRYNLTTMDKLNAIRESLQSQRPGGSASSTLHLVAMLRLIELHRRGLTQLTFHAFGLRSVDVDTPMTDLIGEKAGPLSQTQLGKDEVNPPMKTTPPVAVVAPIGQTSLQKSIFPRPVRDLPSFATGLVSGILFVPVKLDDLELEVANDLLNNLQIPPNDTLHISSLELQRTWSKLSSVNQILTTPTKTTPQLPEEKFMNMGKLAHWIDRSLLEAIEPDLEEEAHQSSSTLFPIVLTELSKTKSISTLSTATSKYHDGLAAAFHINSPKRSRATSIVAQSTSTPARRTYTSRVNLSTALAMLDGSTTRLDTSTILEDTTVHTKTTMDAPASVFSAVFNGPAIPPGALEFRTNLLLGDDFGSDFLLPTQAHSVVDQLPSDQKQSSPRASFPFSQINWSPVLLHSPELESNVVNGTCSSPSLLFSTSVEQKSVEKTDSPPVRQIIDANMRNSSNRLSDSISSPIGVRAPRKRRRTVSAARRFLLSQVNESNATDSDDEFDSPGMDAYEGSFIDDDDEVEKENSKLSKSSMMDIYLQSLRSPPVGGVSRRAVIGPAATSKLCATNRLQSRWSIGGPSNMNRPTSERQTDGVDFIYSQIPEERDDYELDSFCVDSNESANHSTIDEGQPIKRESKPRKRRRLIVIDSD